MARNNQCIIWMLFRYASQKCSTNYKFQGILERDIIVARITCKVSMSKIFMQKIVFMIILTLDPLLIKNVPNHWAKLKKVFTVIGGKFKFSAQGSNLSPFVGNGTKNKIPSDIKPHGHVGFFPAGIKGCVKINPNDPFISLKISASKSSLSNLSLCCIFATKVKQLFLWSNFY